MFILAFVLSIPVPVMLPVLPFLLLLLLHLWLLPLGLPPLPVTWDIRVRFPSARAAGSTYEQQRSQHHNRNTHADRLLGHTRQICPTLIPKGRTGETAQDDTLHKAFVSCANFRGKDSNNLLQLFRDSLQELYDMLYDIDAENLSQPDDFYTALSDATKTTGTANMQPWTHYIHYTFSNYTRSSR
jgi:hypothetical protein